MAKQPLSHYSPKFLNKAWADETGYMNYFACKYAGEVIKKPSGWKQWGRTRGLYSWSVENALSEKLETQIKSLYEKLCSYKELTSSERMLWSQFLLSQLVRTPSFIRYEHRAAELFSFDKKPMNDRVGCKDCVDLSFLANRDWCYLVSHRDDFFVRTDNPVFQTGFIELPDSCIFYPLTPRLCFVACSMKPEWNAFAYEPKETCGYVLEKGTAHIYNFYFSKAADNTLIINPENDRNHIEKMYKEVLASYPQPPFSLHVIENMESVDVAYESIRKIMSITDDYNYPEWLPLEIAPFFQRYKKS